MWNDIIMIVDIILAVIVVVGFVLWIRLVNNA